MHNDKEKEFNFTDDDFIFIQNLVFEISSINLNTSKKNMVYSRLAKVLRKRKLTTFNEYCSLLKSKNPSDMQELINSITTNVTNFFRESHHFDFLQNTMLPDLYKQKINKVRIWSAGCSTGQEPYSIAIATDEISPNYPCDLKILATDLSLDALSTAKSGVYSSEEVIDVIDSRKNKYFKKQDNCFQIKESMQNKITFNQLNLFDNWPFDGPFQVIFCRNVMIYFDKEKQYTLFNKFYRLLDNNGYLILGHSEHIPSTVHGFSPVGKTIYKKIET